MIWVLLWLACIIVSAAILGSHNKAGTGFLLGLLFGPVGVLLAFVLARDATKKEERERHREQMELLAMASGNHKSESRPSQDQRECPWCGEIILAKARICKHCGRDVEPGEPDFSQP